MLDAHSAAQSPDRARRDIYPHVCCAGKRGRHIIAADRRSGDYISGGQTHYFMPADGTFSAYTNYSNGVTVAFNTPGFSHWWYLNFAAAGNQQLTPGVYTNAVRWPFHSSTPGLSVYGDGRGCNTLTGSFEVKEVVYGTDAFGKVTVLSFRASFEQHCEGFAVAARGEIRYNATVPIEITAPTAVNALERDLVSFSVSAADTQGRHVTLSANGVPQGATFVDNGNNTGTFSWLPAEGQAGSYLVTFRGDNDAGNVETTFTAIRIFAAPPTNDDLATPIEVGELPYSHVQNTTRATSAVDDPFCNGSKKTVWYSFTPQTDLRMEFNTFGSDYDTILSVYRGTRGALTQEACNDNAGRTAVKSPLRRSRRNHVLGDGRFRLLGHGRTAAAERTARASAFGRRPHDGRRRRRRFNIGTRQRNWQHHLLAPCGRFDLGPAQTGSRTVVAHGQIRVCRRM